MRISIAADAVVPARRPDLRPWRTGTGSAP